MHFLNTRVQTHNRLFGLTLLRSSLGFLLLTGLLHLGKLRFWQGDVFGEEPTIIFLGIDGFLEMHSGIGGNGGSYFAKLLRDFGVGRRERNK